MTLDQIVNLIVTVTLIEMMATVGLGVTVLDLAGVVSDWRLVGRAMLANYVCVPAATVGLLLLFQAQPMVAAGFLILAVCPGAPFGPPLMALARGNVAVATGLMAILAGSSAVLAPVLLHVLLPLMSGDETLRVDALRVVSTLLLTQLLPLGAGMALRQWRPLLADRLLKPAGLISKVLNLSVVVLILATQFRLLAEIRPRGFVGMFALLVASWAAGWLLAGPNRENLKAMTLTASLRNVGVGLVIATASFPGTPAVTAVLAFGLFSILGSVLLAAAWRRAPADEGAVGADPGGLPSAHPTP